MIPATYPSILTEANLRQVVVYPLTDITGLKEWVDYIPVKAPSDESLTTLADTFANGGFLYSTTLTSIAGLVAFKDYIPVYVKTAGTIPWSTDSSGYIPLANLFSILNLFTNGEQGVWYDPSDFSTMFQDSIGSTPVTAVEQPVGLILDKSKGLVLGSELVTNGTFNTNTTGWSTGAGGTLSVESNQLKVLNTVAGFQAGEQTLSGLTVGRTYKVTSNYSATGGCSCILRILGNSDVTGAIGTSGTLTFYFVATATTAKVQLINGVNTIGIYSLWDNISVKELAGNHASQATSTSRPVLKVDGSGKYYLLFDGVDDSLATAAINFTATDKMTVWAGISVSNVTGAKGIIRLGTGTSGSFWGYSNAAALEYKAQGSSGTSAINNAGYFSAATPLVMTSKINLSGATGADCLKVNKNAVEVATATVASGAANFQNGTITIGLAAGVRLNGNLYSLVVRGAASSATEITNGEQYVAQKTGVTL